jgi:hypothetical protein
MADTKLSDLAALTGAGSASGDLFLAVDVSDTSMAASGTDKKITRDELAIALGVLSQSAADARYSALAHTHSFASLTSKPTTISGYGITDAYTKAEVDDADMALQANIDAALTETEADALYSPLGHTHTFASLTSKPTTVAGYGVTDFNSLGDARWSLLAHTHTFASLTSKPTTISGYGIVDAFTQTAADALYSALGHTHTFASLTSKPTTLAGYGITDALGLHGTADLATALATPRNINGVAFDGTANITVAAAAGTLTGATLAANVLASSLTSVGTLLNLTVTNTITGSISGNAATATALATARAINGVNFDGTAAITVTAAAGTLTGTTLNATVVTSSLTAVGTIATGVWQGTAIAAAYIGSHSHAAADITSGVLAAARIATGTPDGTKFLRDDQVWSTVSATDATKLPLAGGTMTGQITSTLGTITTDIRVLSATATWNASGVTFYGAVFNITNTASAAASKFMDFQIGGVSKASIVKDGTFQASVGSASAPGFCIPGGGGNGFGIYTDVAHRMAFAFDGVPQAALDFRGSATNGWTIRSNGYYGFSSSTDVIANVADVALGRTSARRAQINNGTAGTFGDLDVRSLFTSASSTTQAGLRLPHGSAPTTPVDGDEWSTTSGRFCRINGVTKQYTLT